MPITILIRGSGDIGSAVAHAVFKADYPVLIHEVKQPSTTRRRMAFCDAIFDGCATLDGINAQLCRRIPETAIHLAKRVLVPISTLDLTFILDVFKPEVLVDARMRKHYKPEIQISLAPFTIGLGPNFIAGETVHAAVETGWNEELGRIVWQGATRPLEGEPQTIAGHARDRYVYAPADGIFHTGLQPGHMVSAGQEVARLDEIPLYAPIDGMLRGLTHDGVPVAQKTKIIEVDPRGQQAQISGIPERPRRIAAGVLLAIKMWQASK